MAGEELLILHDDTVKILFFLSYLANRLLRRLSYPVSGVDVPGHLGQFIGPGRRLPLRPAPLRAALCGLQLDSGPTSARRRTEGKSWPHCRRFQRRMRTEKVRGWGPGGGRDNSSPWLGHAPTVVLHSWTGKKNLNCRTRHWTKKRWHDKAILNNFNNSSL